MATRQLTITLGERDRRLDVSSLLTALQNAVAILQDIDCTIGARRQPALDWYIVSARMESPFAAILESAPRGTGEEYELEVLRPFARGMREIEDGATMPRYFTTAALVRAKKIVALCNNGVSYIEFKVTGEAPIRPTQHLAANVDQVLGVQPHGYVVETELEGCLESISLHGRSPEFRIYDPITDQPIKCIFAEADLERVANFIKRRARVRVLGLAHYNQNNRPVSIEVESITELPAQSELPQILDLHRAGIDITHGQDSVEYIRGIRDAG